MVVMRKRSLLFLGVLLSLCVLGGVVPSDRAGATTIYTNDANRFAFAVPDSWTRNPASAPNIAASYIGSDPTGFFIVGVYPAIPGASLDDSMGLAINRTAKAVSDYTFIAAQATMLGGEPARQVTFSGTNQGIAYMGAQGIVLHGSNVYVITFGALPGDVDAFKAQAGVPLATWMFL